MMGKRKKRSKSMGQKITDRLLSDPGVADKLRLVDAYIAHQNRAGRHYVLPREHVELKELIDEYSGQFPKFVGYVKYLRDTVPPRSEAYISLHELYRTLDVRLVQQQRRDRARRAMDLYESKNPRASWEEKTRWLRKIEQSWGRRRMAYLDELRRKTVGGRLTTEEREDALKAFWRDIDKEIDAGDL